MPTTMRSFVAAIAVFLFIPATHASAQHRRGLVDISRRDDRHGFWLTIGAGAGSENYRYTNDVGCNAVIGAYQCDNNVKPSFTLALGGTVNPQLRLGGEIHGWVWDHFSSSANEQVTSYLVGGLLTGQLYPARKMGLFVKGGLGISRSGESFQYSGNAGETGFAYLVGAGYEIKLARTIFLTPTVSMMRHISTNPNDVQDLGTFHERLLSVGIGLTIQPGR